LSKCFSVFYSRKYACQWACGRLDSVTASRAVKNPTVRKDQTFHASLNCRSPAPHLLPSFQIPGPSRYYFTSSHYIMASHSISAVLSGGDSNMENGHEIDSEPEDEVDELDSDSDVDEQGASTSTKKNGVGKSGGERIPGHSLLPALRLENIIQADGRLLPKPAL
jgi:hypothetical protein